MTRITTNDHFFVLFPAEQKFCTVDVKLYSYKTRVKQFSRHCTDIYIEVSDYQLMKNNALGITDLEQFYHRKIVSSVSSW